MMIQFKDFSFRYIRRARASVQNLNFTIHRGEKVLLLGPSGAGKSTLLHLIAGVISEEEGKRHGTMSVDTRAAMVLQDPDSQIVMHTIGDDVAFSCENYAVQADEIWPRVQHSLDQVSLDFPLTHDSYALSGGQKQKLALANMLAINTELLLLDEPTANLDTVGAHEVKESVMKMMNTEQTLIVVEHHVELWADVVHRVIVLDEQGEVALDGSAEHVFANKELLARLNIWYPGIELDYPRMKAVEPSEVAMKTESLAVGYGQEENQALLQGISQEFFAGQSYALLGKNGMGKSTLSLTLAGLQKPLAGTITPDFSSVNSKELAQKISVVFQNPEHQFIFDTVSEELGAAHEDLVGRLGLEELKDANPFTLSGGQKRRLSVATAVQHQPEIIFLDEPTFGQDPAQWLVLVDILQKEMARGACLIISTHDDLLVDALNAEKIEVCQWS